MAPTQNPDDFRKITEIFERARELAPGERSTYLAAACGDDKSLRSEVEALLAMHDAAAAADESFLDAGRALRDAFVETRMDDSEDRDASPIAHRAFPESVGRYRIVDKIAQGGVGAVLKGKDDVIGRDIAIKILLDSHRRNPELVERLTEEAQIGGQLQHPGIVPVYEFGLLGGDRPYITMKLVEGRTLADLLAERADPGEERLHFLGIFEQVCQAMAYAHSRRVIHRDLKPLNLMVGAFGEVQVMDWGLAKVVSRERTPRRDLHARTVYTVRTGQSDSASLTGSVMGTPMYMSPEQARGEIDELDARTDVFSLGAILCEILTGRPPYTGDTLTEIVRQASEGDLRDAFARLRASDADAEVIALAGRCLAPRRNDRPADARSLAEEMRRYLESLEERAREAALKAAAAQARARSERKARLLTTAIGVVITLAILIGGGGYTWYERDRQARLHRSTTLVERSMVEAEQLLREARAAGPAEISRWEAALVTAQSARDLASEGLREELSTRAAALAAEIENGLRSARLIQSITKIRADYDYVDRLAENPDHDRRYAEAFRDYLGEYVDALEPRRVADQLVAGGFSEEIGQALDEWSRIRRRIDDDRGAAANGWKRLLVIARIVDPDPLRSRLRSAVEADDLQTLRTIAGSPELSERSPFTISLLSRVLSASRDYASSRAVLRIGQEAHPTDFWLTFNLARSLSLEDPTELQESIPFYRAAIALRPDYPVVHGSLGNAYARLDQTARAIATIRQGLRLAPDSATLHLQLGNALQATGDLKEAEAAHRRALELSPRDPRTAGLVYMNLAYTLFRTNRVDEAVPLFEKSLELHPDIALSHFYLGQVAIRRGELNQAIEHLRAALRVGPDSWRAFEMHGALGSALLRIGDVPGAVEEFTESVRLDPTYVFGHVALGSARLRLGQLDPAVKSLCEAIRLDAREETAYNQLLDIVLRYRPSSPQGGGLRVSPAALAEVITLLDGVLHQGAPYHPEARHLYLEAWCEAPEMLYNARVLAAARQEVEAKDGDPHALGHLGEVQLLLGQPREAIRTLEEAARSTAASRKVYETLHRCREKVLPDLATYASVDAVLAELPRDASEEQCRERFAAFLSLERTEDRSLRVTHLEGRLLQRQGRDADAVEKFLSVLEVDRSDPEPFIALWESLQAAKGRAEARALFDTMLGAGPAPSLPYRPEPPTARLPAPEGTVASLSTTLEASPFEHLDSRVRHRSTHWQVRTADADFSRNPLIDLFTSEHLHRLTLPVGLLLTGDVIVWRVRYQGSDDRFSPFSGESSFKVLGIRPLEAVPFDLTAHFRHDVIANVGDRDDDPFDQVGYRLVAELPPGSQLEVQGLPAGGAVGVHRLASYDDPNALRIERGMADAVRVEVPVARYVALRFLVSGANGGSSVPVTLELADGAREESRLPCGDWFDDPGDRDIDAAPILTPVWNGMDRASPREGLDDANDPALFEVVLPVRGSAELRAFVLHPAGASYDTDETRFYLFAATGIRG